MAPAATARPHKLSPAETKSWIQAVAGDWQALGKAPLAVRMDPRLGVAAIKQDWRAIQFAGENLRADKDFVLQALSLSGFALQFASEELRCDREVVLAAVQQDGCAIRHAFYQSFREDLDVMKEAVANDWRAMQYASTLLQKNKELALFAVKQSWEAVQFIDEELQGDYDVMDAAVAQNGEALRYASEKLRANQVLARKAAENGWQVVAEGSEISLQLRTEGLTWAPRARC
mmetsp:Transcript_39608/g.91530  ORF Transcript_39608/g.91530 Transcript_39608/m.91530 type:complete len:231 (-) Transcript_39608:30-722(-)